MIKEKSKAIENFKMRNYYTLVTLVGLLKILLLRHLTSSFLICELIILIIFRYSPFRVNASLGAFHCIFTVAILG